MGSVGPQPGKLFWPYTGPSDRPPAEAGPPPGRVRAEPGGTGRPPGRDRRSPLALDLYLPEQALETVVTPVP